ncbi:transcription elongation factor A N-terminal and central domain-containing protein isoform X1 [Hippoglossus hippoglossus]|uniref:transcription elongation factor A N-terminal and central domain-containing protein isoform X1 n=1 Tax=Hippoglossus hippoglossus TaxID=8267 RepID=UPI00148CF465|nr:transcription elongation factor A N-terminal and central domain-containing protein isoform X1 [Hippoglossus hippoglossus]XP_034464925.1 transcription elongation factor A N-terminal and central domain-containing protein isoform X1 [Hippoglossus hippoglossus]
MDAKEMVHCALQIEKMTSDRSYGNIWTLLGDLDKSQVTAEQLEVTDIVRVLYRLLRTCSDDGVRKKVKSLLSKWKRQYSKCKGESQEDGGGSRQEEDPTCGSAQAGDGGGSVKVEAEQEASSTVEQHDLQTPTSSASSSVRDKCAQLLLAALHPEPPDQDEASRLAGDIERHVHELHKHSEVKYKTCVRSKVANLRNPKNGHLRRGLLSGSLTPEAFARMSAKEMASDELRQLREEYSSRGVSERQLPQVLEGTQTQKIRCKRCGGSDCSVTQVSRGALFLPAWVRRGGADEDAMTFVTCSACGQQWYHSGWVCL